MYDDVIIVKPKEEILILKRRIEVEGRVSPGARRETAILDGDAAAAATRPDEEAAPGIAGAQPPGIFFAGEGLVFAGEGIVSPKVCPLS